MIILIYDYFQGKGDTVHNSIRNQFHLVQDEDVNVIFHIPSSNFFRVNMETFNRVKDYIDGNCENDTEVEEKLSSLSSVKPVTKMRPIKLKELDRVSFLSAETCNIACKYCFANQGSYTSKNEKKMPLEIYKKSIEWLLKIYPEGIRMIHFFGGEPMLGFEEIKSFVPYCKELFKERSLKEPIFAVVTNGTLITKEMVDFFNTYNIQVTISIDGPKEINDKIRVSRAGWSVFDKIRDSINYLNSERKFPLRAEITLNKQHILQYTPGSVEKWLEEISSFGFDAAIIGIAESENELCEITEKDEDVLKAIEREAIEFFFNRLCKGEDFFCPEIIGTTRGIARQKSSVPCSAGYNGVSITVDGDVLPCYQFHGVEEFNMGSVFKDDTEAFGRVSDFFINYEEYKPEECKECWARNLCTVWCKGFSFSKYGDVSNICNSRCWLSKAEIEGVLLNLAKIESKPNEYKKMKNKMFEICDKYKYND